jgi:hypothetical protein
MADTSPNWRDLHDAPRDRPVWLFLPSSKFTADSAGRPISVEHEVLVGGWRGDQSAWLCGERAVYPSLWCDADVSGPAPASPLLVT